MSNFIQKKRSNSSSFICDFHKSEVPAEEGGGGIIAPPNTEVTEKRITIIFVLEPSLSMETIEKVLSGGEINFDDLSAQ